MSRPTQHAIALIVCAALITSALGLSTAAACPGGTWDDDPTQTAERDMNEHWIQSVEALPAPYPVGASGSRFQQAHAGLVLVGAVVRSGDIIDGLTPIYATVGPQGRLSPRLTRGDAIGGDGGGGHLVHKPGHVVVGVEYEQVNYYGHSALRNFKLVFRAWSKGAPTGPEITSEAFSTRVAAGSPWSVRAAKGDVVSGLHGVASAYVNTLSIATSDADAPLDSGAAALPATSLDALQGELDQERARHEAAALAKKEARDRALALEEEDRRLTSTQLKTTFAQGRIDGDIDLEVQGGDFGAFDGKLRLLYPHASAIRGQFTAKRRSKRVVMRLNHLSSGLGGRKGYSPITVTVNGQVVVADLDPRSDGYTVDRIDLTEHVKPGSNTFAISFGAGSSHYWIADLSIWR